MKNIVNLELQVLSNAESIDINGGDSGDALYAVCWIISMYIRLEIDLVKANFKIAEDCIDALDTAWRESTTCPVSVAEWN
jgi:hypothetical protein